MNFCVLTMTSFNRHFSLNCFHPDNCIINNINGQQETWYRINVEIVCIENRFCESAFLLAISQAAPAARLIRSTSHSFHSWKLLSCTFVLSRQFRGKLLWKLRSDGHPQYNFRIFPIHINSVFSTHSLEFSFNFHHHSPHLPSLSSSERRPANHLLMSNE